MGWVGDEDGTYEGLKTALRYMLESGRRGYVGFGSDIGGYRAAANTTHGRTKAFSFVDGRRSFELVHGERRRRRSFAVEVRR